MGRFIRSFLLYSLVFFPIVVVAQEKEADIVFSKDSLQVVTVYSHTAKHAILTNPMPIVTIRQKQIERTIASNVIDALVANIPGLNAVKTGPNISKPFIRGLGYNRVLTLFDGIRQEGQQWGDEHGLEIDAYNLSKVDVIKGPASILYGSDALAGVVSLVPNLPLKKDNSWHGNFASEYQTNNNLIGNGGYLNYNGQRFMMSASGSYRIAQNYRNAIDGRVYNTNFREANAALMLGYYLKKGYVTLNGTLYHNLQGIPDGSRDSLTRKFTKQVAEGVEDAIDNRPIVSDAELNSYGLSPLHQKIRHYRIYSKLYQEVRGGDLSVTIAFQQNNRVEYSHPTIPSQAGMDMRLQTINYDLKWNQYHLIPNTMVAIGLNGMYQNNKNQNATDFPIPDYNLFDGGAFAYAKWGKNNWTISGGIRWDMRHTAWNDFYIVTDDATGFDRRATSETKDAMLQFDKFSKNYNGLSLSLGATYKINERMYAKFNIARGYRTPNMTELASNGLDPGAHIIYLGNRDFKPEFSLQQDAGLHFGLADVDMDFSVFNNNISNYIYLSMQVDGSGSPIMDAQGNKTYQYQQAKAQLYGVEASVLLHPTALRGFSWSNSFSLIYGWNRKGIYKNKGIEGAYLPFIPPAKLLSTLKWELDLPSASVLKSITPQYEMDANATQNRFMGLNNTETRTTGYVLHNMGVFTDWKLSPNKTITLMFMVNNLLDKAYQSNMSRLKYLEYYSSSPNGRYGIYNMGRNFSVKLVVPF